VIITNIINREEDRPKTGRMRGQISALRDVSTIHILYSVFFSTSSSLTAVLRVDVSPAGGFSVETASSVPTFLVSLSRQGVERRGLADGIHGIPYFYSLDGGNDLLLQAQLRLDRFLVGGALYSSLLALLSRKCGTIYVSAKIESSSGVERIELLY
jgi:hypothetical protein